MKKKKNNYFTKIHEQAIIDYAKSDDKKVKTELYIQFIQPAFDEMVEKIVYTYKFTNLPNIEELKDECKIWLTTILDKYDVTKKSKAFSYFSVITKNWFIAKVKKNSKALQREVSYETLLDQAETYPFQEEIINPYHRMREHQEFFFSLNKKIDKWESETIKERDKRVLQAIKVLFESVDDIEIFNKKAIYLYIREITGLNTKQVVSSLNKIKIKYRTFKVDWEDGKF
tara:strand:+ start:397 stop:1080 length:684 start_codon:yes stop_codon:yes gene_type:complete